MIKLYIILLILLVFLIYYYYNYKNDVKNIYFLEKDELSDILCLDQDNYYETFYKIDFKVRNIKNIDEYKNMIKKSVCEINDDQKNKIINCIKKADEFFSTLNLKWLDGKKMNNIQWKIGCIDGKLYEYGMPHTRNDIIVIPLKSIKNNKKFVKTLIHEKIHIFQKMYPNDINHYINYKQFSKFKIREENDKIRANPDLDNWIYKRSNNIYMAKYKKNAKTIKDVKYYPINKQSCEHPFEMMAIEIEKFL